MFTNNLNLAKYSWFQDQLEILKKQVENTIKPGDESQIIEAIEGLLEIEEKFSKEKEGIIDQLNGIQAEIDHLKQLKQGESEALSLVKSKKKDKDREKEKEINDNIKTLEEEIQLAEDKKKQEEADTTKSLLDLIDGAKVLMEIELADRLDQGEYSQKLRNIVNAYHPIPLSFNLADSRTFNVLEQHIASNKEDAGGLYARTQQGSRSQKYNLEKLENKFQDNINGLIHKDKSSSVGANNTKVNSIYLFKSNKRNNANPISQSRKSTVMLKDDILKHKCDVVKIIVDNMQNKKLTSFCVNSNQLEAYYPCLMIQFTNPPLDKNKETIEGYSEFVTHLMIAKINAVLKARGLTPLIDRRQSFGFLTPTLTDTHTAVRLSLGLTPHTNWIEAVQDGIVSCDKILSQLCFKEATKKDATDYICLDQYMGGDFTGYAHKLLEEITGKCSTHAAEQDHFLACEDCKHDSENLIRDINFLGLNVIKKNNKNADPWLTQSAKIVDIDSMPENLTEYRGKYLLLNNALYYVSYTRKIKQLDIIDQKLFEEKIITPFLRNKKQGESSSSKVLGNETMKNITGRIHPVNEVVNIPLAIKKDDIITLQYNQLYEKVDAVLTTLARCWVEHHHDDKNESIIITDDTCKIQQNTKALIIKSNVIASNFFTKLRDLTTFDTSDDDEPFIDDHEESKKNYRTPWGMSAIFAPMEALRRTLSNDAYPLPYECAPYSYFEINLAWNGALLSSHFVRSDRVRNYLIHNVIRTLLDELRRNPFSCSKEDGKLLIEVNNREFDKEVYKDFITKYVQKICHPEYDSKKVFRESSNDLFAIMQSTTSPRFSAVDAGNLLHKLHFSTMQSIADYCKLDADKTLDSYFQNIANAKIVHIDANPCVNRSEKVMNCADAIKELSQRVSPPKVLVVDTTSTTQDQLNEIIKEFDQQDKIPLLVTAMSGLKNSQLGLDCFPYGENKIYKSKSCLQDNEENNLFCDNFSGHLKDITCGTEIGVSRLFRRELNSSVNSIEKRSLNK